MELETPRGVLTRIAHEVAVRHRTGIHILQGNCRLKHLVDARVEFFVRAYNEGFSVTQLGAFLHKDRTTVVHHLVRSGLIPSRGKKYGKSMVL
jgi:hypothetical protein